jgi:catechol 2,3-dioxygenase-like lactoylglutathione lyase family enzyme
MKLEDFYPIIVTPKLFECRNFYVRWFGFTVGFESSWFIWMSSADGARSLAFMHPDHPSSPPGPEPFSGLGMCLEFQVENVQAEYKRLQSEGAAIEYSLRDEPFGQRRFGLHDPAGVWIDIVQQIESAQGYWEKYFISPDDTK